MHLPTPSVLSRLPAVALSVGAMLTLMGCSSTQPAPLGSGAAAAAAGAEPAMAAMVFAGPVALHRDEPSSTTSTELTEASKALTTEPASATKKSEWEFSTALGGWLPTMDGKLGADGQTGRVNLSYHDVFKLITDNYNGGGFWDLHAKHDRLTLYTIGLTFDLEDEENFNIPVGPGLPTKLEPKFEFTIAEFGAMLDMGAIQAADVGAGPLEWRALVGGRYIDFETKVRLSVQHPVLGETVTRSAKGSQDWVDGIVGLEADLPLCDDWTLTAHGDVGGFGIGSSSRSTWRVEAAVIYRASESISILAGWNILSVDHRQGSGSSEDIVDLKLSGPEFGVIIDF